MDEWVVGVAQKREEVSRGEKKEKKRYMGVNYLGGEY